MNFKITDAWLAGIEILCELEAMKSLNTERQSKGLSQAYGELAFYDLCDKIAEIRKGLE